MRTQLSDDAWASLAKSLDVEEAALKAVAAVEAAGAGFLRGEPPRPKILFEAHAFHRLTGGRFAKQAPNLSHPTWDRSRYAGSRGRGVEAARSGVQPRSARGAASRELGPVPDHGVQLRLLRLPRRRGVRREAARRRRRAAGVLRALHRAAAVPAGVARQAVAEVRRGVQRPGAGEEPLRREDRRRLCTVRCARRPEAARAGKRRRA